MPNLAPVRRRRTACRTLVAAAFLGLAPLAGAQATNQITAVAPSSAAQGASGLRVTFTLDTDSPPAPPAGVPPASVTIGTLAGTSVTHAAQYDVTAVFAIPAAEATGPKDCAVVFSLPTGGTLTFSLPAGFTVTAGSAGPPSITRQPSPVTACAGSSATFAVEAVGEAPLAYRWQKDRADVPGAAAATLTVAPVTAGDAGAYRCVVTNGLGEATSAEAALTVLTPPCTGLYPVVDTGQSECYDNTNATSPPATGAAFFGQDAQHAGHAPAFTLSADGLTVHDDVTDLTWQHSPDIDGDGSVLAADKLTLAEARARPAVLNAARFGGFDDWRLPTIKELYSLIDYRGTDPSGLAGNDTSGLTPFIDRTYFHFDYGDTSAGERVIDSQYASSNVYVDDPSDTGMTKLFGVNFADGRIKGYDLQMPGGGEKTFTVLCVRGNPAYGMNAFTDNGDGTVSDAASGLTWSQPDSGSGMNWADALAWAWAKNAERWLGHDDWRLPDVKELQSIVDYARSPDTSGSAAIAPVFSCTPITNEAGQADYPCYWSSTTHAAYNGMAANACYVAFGKAMGYMGSWTDVHGAGSQRSDPKDGNPADYPTGHGPQGDAVRIFNYVRLVRDDAPVAGRAILRLALADPRTWTAQLPLDPARDRFGDATASPFTIPGDATAAAGALIYYDVPDALTLDVTRQGGDVSLGFAP